MGLSGWIRDRAAPRPLLVTARGGRVVRLAAERLARERGWDLAAAPAEADLLVVCGVPDAVLGAAVERVWSQLPSPRARSGIGSADDVVGELDRAHGRLVDPERQRADSAERAAADSTGGAARGGHGDDDHTGHGETQDADAASDASSQTHPEHPMLGDPVSGEPDAGSPSGHDMPGAEDMPTGHDMGAGHDMGGHDMHMMHGGEVAGLPTADRAPDRDGLTLDVLHVTLGPVLADWPAGLVVQVTLQGDVVQSAQVDVVGEPGSPWDGPPAAAALDSLARLLAVCGASTAARTARRLRDDLLSGDVDDAEMRRFARRLRRSRTLRWATDGIGRLDDTHGDLAGDATDRWLRWVAVVEGNAPTAARDAADRARTAVEVLPELLEGQELAAARVAVASSDPDLDALVAPDAAAVTW